MAAVIMSNESKMYMDNLDDDQDNTESVSKTANQEDVDDNVITESDSVSDISEVEDN